MQAHVYALRSWTIKKHDGEFYIAATAQSGKHHWRGPYSTLQRATRGGSRMQESCTYGSVRGAPSNGRPYRNRGKGPTLRVSVLLRSDFSVGGDDVLVSLSQRFRPAADRATRLGAGVLTRSRLKGGTY